jgi:hypothetical protein
MHLPSSRATEVCHPDSPGPPEGSWLDWKPLARASSMAASRVVTLSLPLINGQLFATVFVVIFSFSATCPHRSGIPRNRRATWTSSNPAILFSGPVSGGNSRPGSSSSSRHGADAGLVFGGPNGADGREMNARPSAPIYSVVLPSLPMVSRYRPFRLYSRRSAGGLAEPAGEVVVQVLLGVAYPGYVAVWA